MPRRSLLCEQRLKDLGVLGSFIHREEYSLDLIPFDGDLLSMESEGAFKVSLAFSVLMSGCDFCPIYELDGHFHLRCTAECFSIFADYILFWVIILGIVSCAVQYILVAYFFLYWLVSVTPITPNLSLPSSVPHWFLVLSFFGWGGDEVEKNSFIGLPGKGGHSGLMPSKLCVPSWRE